MDFNQIFLSFPHVAQLIFEQLDPKTLEGCSKVSETWRKFLENDKFYWVKLSQDHPGWEKFEKSVNFETFVAYGKSFLTLKSSEDSYENIDPIFCSIQLNDLEIFKTLISQYKKDHPLPKRPRNPYYPHRKLERASPLFSPLHEDHNQPKMHARKPFSITYMSPLHFAARMGNYQFVEYIQQTEKREKKQYYGQNVITPLHLASEAGHLEIVKLILHNVKLEECFGNGGNVTPLHSAALNGHLEVLRVLLNSITGDFETNDRNPWDIEGVTPLHLAAEKGHFEIAKLLIDHIDDDCNPKDKYDKTPLHCSVEHGHAMIVELLLKHSYTENLTFREKRNGETPLHIAVEKGYATIVKLLVSKIGDKNVKNNRGMTPLHMASEKGNIEIVKLIVQSDIQRTFGKIQKLNDAIQVLYDQIPSLISPKDSNGKTPAEMAANEEIRNFLQSAISNSSKRSCDISSVNSKKRAKNE